MPDQCESVAAPPWLRCDEARRGWERLLTGVAWCMAGPAWLPTGGCDWELMLWCFGMQRTSTSGEDSILAASPLLCADSRTDANGWALGQVGSERGLSPAIHCPTGWPRPSQPGRPLSPRTRASSVPSCDPVQGLTIADYGDAPVNPTSWYRSLGSIRAFVREVAETGAIPLIVGGDHAIMYRERVLSGLIAAVVVVVAVAAVARDGG